MSQQKITIKTERDSSVYEITIAHGLLSAVGKWARQSVGGDTERLLVVSNAAIFKLYGAETAESLRSAGFSVDVFLIRDGERHKTLRTAERILRFLAESGLTRTDAVAALGGGVVGDVAGFAAALHLRGMAFLQIPTTLLSMIDSSVGGKTGVNSVFGKNMIGAFHQPAGVLIDPSVLRTLPRREIVAGMCEAIKQGAIGGRGLLAQTSRFLSEFPVDSWQISHELPQFQAGITEVIAEQVKFKAKIVAADERESSWASGTRSRKILNFGHTLAHALEKVTDYRYFKHGEAVGYGILFAAELSKKLELSDEKDVELLNDVVQSAGQLPPLTDIGHDKVLEAFKFDKKNLSGSLQFVLIKGIGKPVIISEKDIPPGAIKKVLRKFLQQRS
ncbi:MAG TPA: 3-dehydroquinate synthase [Pyrinomonadaceae bacterium]|nr:3-dehydroquinate synthase [Pyrinomonadaceae bacterium]